MKLRKLLAVILALALVVISVLPTFAANSDIAETGAYSASDKFALGIDVSHYQNDATSSKTINFDNVASAQKDFVIIKLLNHVTKDKYFDQNYMGAKEAGLQVGAYIYSTATTVTAVKEEAYAAIDAMQGKYFEYPIYLDFETSDQKNLPQATQNAIIDAFVNILSENGYLPGFYAGREFYINSLDINHLTNLNIPLWYARYYNDSYTSLSCDYPMWQYSCKGQVSGISGDVDLDVVYVDYPTKILNDNLNLWRRNGADTAHLELVSEEYTYNITTSTLNVRDNPGTSGTNKIGAVHSGDEVTVTETTTVGNTKWGKIDYDENGTIGYISLSSNYVTLTDINKTYTQVNDYEDETTIATEPPEAPTQAQNMDEPPYQDSSAIFEKGLDIGDGASSNINFSTIKDNGYSFVYLKIGNNTTVGDNFESNYTAAKLAGLKVGAYLTTSTTFSKSSLEARNQAVKCLELINGKSFEYPIYYYQDISKCTADGAKAYAATGARMFVDMLQGNGFVCGVMNNNNILNDQHLYDNVNGDKALVRYKDYSSLDDYTWGTLYPAQTKIIEYSNMLTGCPGISGNTKAAGMISFYNYPQYIRNNNKNGFSKHLIIPTGNNTTDTASGAIPFNATISQDDGNLMIRPTAGAASGGKGYPIGTELTIDEVTMINSVMWGHTTHNGTTGWVNLNYVERYYNQVTNDSPDPVEPTTAPPTQPTQPPTQPPTEAPTQAPDPVPATIDHLICTYTQSEIDPSKEKLTISWDNGSANLPAFTTSAPAPWYSHKDTVDEIVLDASVIGMNSYAFYGMSALKYIDISSFNKAAAFGGSTGHYFDGCSSIETIDYEGNEGIIISPDLTTFSTKNFFYNCTGLKNINLPGKLATIPEGCFQNCQSIENIALSDKTKTIGKKAFYNSGLLEITIPDTVTSVGDEAFGNCPYLTSITTGSAAMASRTLYVNIGETDTKWNILSPRADGSDTYSYRPAMYARATFKNAADQTIHRDYKLAAVDGTTNPWYYVNVPIDAISVQLYCLVYGTKSIPSVNENTFLYRTNEITLNSSDNTIVIGECPTIRSDNYTPYTYTYTEQTKKQWKMPYENIFNDATFAEPRPQNSTLTIYGYNIYPQTSIQYWFDQNVVASTGEYFDYGPNGTQQLIYDSGNDPHVYIADENETGFEFYIEDGDAYGLRPMDTMSGAITIPKAVLYNETNYDVKSLSESAFSGMDGITTITFGTGSTLETIPYKAFYKTGISTITIPQYVNNIDKTAFNGCTKLASIKVNENNTKYKNSNYYMLLSKDGTKLYTCPQGSAVVSIDDGVTEITDSAFFDCDKITTMIIPNTVTTIGMLAFAKCDKLKTVTFSVGSQITEIPTQMFFKDYSLQTVSGVPSTVTKICYQAFSGCTKLTYTPSNSVTSIENYAFEKNRALTTIDLPNDLMYLGDGAYSGCSGATTLADTTPNEELTKINSYTFSGCTNLNNVTLPSNIKTIDYQAFMNCTSMSNINLPAGLQKIGYSAFEGCSTLNNIALPTSLKNIGYRAFMKCTGLTSINIPDNVSSIGISSFDTCSSLVSVNLGQGITQIKKWAFRNCSLLTSISLPQAVESVGLQAFENMDEDTGEVLGRTPITVTKYNANTNISTLPEGSSSSNFSYSTVVKFNTGNGATPLAPATPSTDLSTNYPVPSKNGSLFLGWNNGNNAAQASDFNTADTELTAQWENIPNVTVNSGETDATDSGTVKGFDLYGVQIRQRDGGLRFRMRISTQLFNNIKAYSNDNKAYYGYVLAAKSQVPADEELTVTNSNITKKIYQDNSNSFFKTYYQCADYITYTACITNMTGREDYDIVCRPYIKFTDKLGNTVYRYCDESGKNNCGDGYYTSIKTIENAMSGNVEQQITINNVDDYADGTPFVYLNYGKSDFTAQDKAELDEYTRPNHEDTNYTKLTPLDNLGRTIKAEAKVTPTTVAIGAEARGAIGSVIPTGYISRSFDNVTCSWIYNRCHLVGHQLTGLNAVNENLMTGTRYLNIDGMVWLENRIKEFVVQTGESVYYSVEVIYTGNNLVGDAFHIKAYSANDDGENIDINIYSYNYQPGITIDYATGESSMK